MGLTDWNGHAFALVTYHTLGLELGLALYEAIGIVRCSQLILCMHKSHLSAFTFHSLD